MKRLFQLRTERNGQPLELYFADKMSAKKARDRINQQQPGATTVVSYGPDHKLFKENNNAS